MGLNIEAMKRIASKQHQFMLNVAVDSYNKTIDEFDAEVRGCDFYEPATCHGEYDPECTHKDNEGKWCEAGNCPLLQ